jgi:hypothetical protein
MVNKPLSYFLLYVLAIFFALASIFLCSCAIEKDIQVQRREWKLIDKISAVRWTNNGDGDFVWLVWQTPDGDQRFEKTSIEVATTLPIGTVITNRDKK